MDLKQKQLASAEQEAVLRRLAGLAGSSGCKFLEVGSWLGDSTVILGKVAKSFGGILFCVDWWKGNAGTDLVDIAAREDVFSIFWSRICKEGLDDVIVPIRSRSDVAAEILRENSFDLVFLDADHRYENVLSDIKRFSSLVKKDRGVLCGHDCEGRITDYDTGFLKEGANVDCYEGVHCGVVKAVGESFSDYLIVHSIWCVCFSLEQKAWGVPDIKFPEISNERQTLAPPMAYSCNYSLVRFGKFVYAVPRTGLPPAIKNEKDLVLFCVAFANSWQALEEKIQEKAILRLESYKNFNILKRDNAFYALMDLSDLEILFLNDESVLEEKRKANVYFSARDIFELRRLIGGGEFYEKKTMAAVPLLVEEGYSGYNIIRLGDSFWAVPQSLGPIDVSGPGGKDLMDLHVKQGKCYPADSLFEAKYLISRSVIQARDKTVRDLNAELDAIRSTLWFRLFRRISNIRKSGKWIHRP